MTTNRLAKPAKGPKLTLEEHCENANNHLVNVENRHDVRWIIRKDELVLDWTVRPHITAHPYKHPMDRRGEPMSGADTAILNRCLEEAGATARYMPDGSRYTIDKQAAA